MYTCPTCQTTHDEHRFYCDGCVKFYCSLGCLKYQDFPEYNVLYRQDMLNYTYSAPNTEYWTNGYIHEMTDLSFICCDTCYCAKCHSQLINSPQRENILFCDMCKRFFHNDCHSDLKYGYESCMCPMCISLELGLKIVVCKNCHEAYNVRPVSMSDLNDLKQFISFDSPEWKKLIYKDDSNSKDGEQDISFDFSKCQKYQHVKEALENLDTIKEEDVLVKCDCELCRNIKCPTTLFRLMYNYPELLDITDDWDKGHDISPILALEMFTSHCPNKCHCEVCQFWGYGYSEEY